MTWATLPWWRRYCIRINLLDKPGHRKIHKTSIPLAGGLAVWTGIAMPLVLGGLVSLALLMPHDLSGILSHGFSRRTSELAAILLGTAGMLVLGILDDNQGLSPAKKFLGQMIVALLVAASGIRATLFVESQLFSYVVTVLWIVTVTNAMNFQDNMNGLCVGLGLIAGWYFAWHAAVEGQYLVSMLGFLYCGALAGFLPYNFPNASAFLGDAGSHLVGFLLAIMAILPDFHSEESQYTLLVLSPLLILVVPLADLVSVVFIRLRKGKPVTLGDNNHFSHRLVRHGCSQSQAVLLLCLAGAIVGALTFLG